MWNLAQLNIGRMKGATIDDPIMAEFKNRLDEINALAESSPGFIWRLKEENGNATSIPFSDDPRIILNMSVWKDIESLETFTYKTMHTKVMAQRRNWFEKMDHYMCLFYVPTDYFPTVEDAQRRLGHLQTNGPTPYSFTFRERFSSAELAASVYADKF